MTCRELTDFILDYVEDTLEPEVRVRFEHHLTLCPTCVSYLSAYRGSAALVRGAFEDEDQSVEQAGVPESLIRAVLSARGAAHRPA